ncbi:MAG: O-antigen ligase family protein [Thermogutta sp.]
MIFGRPVVGRASAGTASGKPRVWRWLARDPYTLLAVVSCLAFFLAGVRDLSGIFLPYRWWFLAVFAISMLASAANAFGQLWQPEHRCLLWLIAVGAVSCTISPMPEYSFTRLGTFIVMFLAVFVGAYNWLRRHHNIAIMVHVLLLIVIIGTLLSLHYQWTQFAVLIPQTRLTGAFQKATGTGSFAAAAIPLALWAATYRHGRQKVFYIFIVIGLLYILFFSGARAAIIGGLLATLLWLWKHQRAWRPILVVALFSTCFLATTGVITPDMLPEYIVRKESLPTFSGRIPRWKLGLKLFAESPILGHGYGMTRYIRVTGSDEESGSLEGQIVPGEFRFTDLLPGAGDVRLGRMTLHSDHVERLLETGILGYVPFAMFWFFIVRRMTRLFSLPADVGSSLAIAFGLNVGYIFLDSFMHGTLFAVNAPGTILAWFNICLFMCASQLITQKNTSRVSGAHPSRHP